MVDEPCAKTEFEQPPDDCTVRVKRLKQTTHIVASCAVHLVHSAVHHRPMRIFMENKNIIANPSIVPDV